MKTKSQAINWLNNRIGRRLDMDGWYGSQCMDLTIGYWRYLTDGKDRPDPGNAITLINTHLPKGWKRIKNTPEFVPQAGDIAIWGYAPYNVYGHTAIITYATVNYFYSVDQNWFNPSLEYGSPAAKVYHDYTGFWGVIRPAYAKSSTKKKSTSKTSTNITSNVWRRNDAGILWKTEKATFTCNVDSGIKTHLNGPWTGWGNGPDMEKGESIKYEEIQDFDGLIWVSGNFKGKYTYVPIGYSNGKGQRVGSAWGTFS